MSRAVLKRTSGDFGDTLTFNLQESDGSASDLTGQTGVRLHVRLEGDQPGVDALRVDRPMVVPAPPTNGVVTIVIVVADFPFAGLFFAQIEATFAAGVVTWDIAIITVEDQYG
ncbi:MAG: hypothetical protein V3U45_08000 [bacterium]